MPYANLDTNPFTSIPFSRGIYILPVPMGDECRNCKRCSSGMMCVPSFALVAGKGGNTFSHRPLCEKIRTTPTFLLATLISLLFSPTLQMWAGCLPVHG